MVRGECRWSELPESKRERRVGGRAGDLTSERIGPFIREHFAGLRKAAKAAYLRDYVAFGFDDRP